MLYGTHGALRVQWIIGILGFTWILCPPAAAQDWGNDSPCADSLRLQEEGWERGSWWEPTGEDCDPEEYLLFAEKPRPSNRDAGRPSNRTAFTLTRNASGVRSSTVRQRVRNPEWSHSVEIRNDTLTRKWLSHRGDGWRWVVGDLDAEGSGHPEFRIWPEALPRRTLPRGWRRAAQRLQPGYGLSSDVPQGVAAGVERERWKAWAVRVWNPVESGDEPPWNGAFNLRHTATGVSVSLPWTVTALVSDTRIARGGVDSLAEQLASVSLSSPRQDFILTGAILPIGWALAAEGRHRFDNEAEVELTLRQRDADWRSAWDPAVTDLSMETSEDEEVEEAEPDWGAGEYRLNAEVPWESYGIHLENWRAWNPQSGAGREGTRGRLTWKDESVRFALGGTLRSSRTASGSVSHYRSLETEARLTENPKFRLHAFRFWNAKGPTRTGMNLAMEPAGNSFRFPAAVLVETDAQESWSAQGSIGMHWVFAQRWSADAAVYASLRPWTGEATRWRANFTYSE